MDFFYASDTKNCKECVKARVKLRRRDDDAVREYDRVRAKLSKRKAASRAAVVKWRKDNPEGYLAHNMVNNAIRDGKMERQLCEICGAVAHAHHEDYMKPLDVRWLCPLHHQRLHASPF